MVLLKVDSVTKKFGGLTAVNNVSLDVEKGEIRGLIGPNGSGKTTLLYLISGVYKVDTGSVLFNGERIDNLLPHKIFSKGISMTFQIPRVFMGMSLVENLLVPFFARWPKKSRDEGVQKALEILDFLALTPVKDHRATDISGGQQILLEIGRAMMTDPILYLLDEPFAGVNPAIKETIVETICELNERRERTFIVVSHETSMIAGVCGKLTVLNSGLKIADGNCDEILRSSEVIEAYLGD